MMFKYLLTCLLIISINLNSIKSDVVCSEDELVKEILEDLADNGKLDCLRESLPLVKNETVEQKDLREKANWNSDCSFEAESDEEGKGWKDRLQLNYKLTKGLVDVDGNPVDSDFDDQADMCEMVRALIFNGFFPNVSTDISNISKDVVQYIDCPGQEGATAVCAANAGSFANKKSWYVFLDGSSIKFNGKPKYHIK